MTKGEAIRIFKDIDNDTYTDKEKITAICKVTELETHNSITKRDILRVLKWLVFTEENEG